MKLSDQEIKLLWAKKEAKKIWEMTLGSDDDETPSILEHHVNEKSVICNCYSKM